MPVSRSAAKARMRTGPGRTFPASWLYVRPDLPVRVANMSTVWTVLYTKPSRYNWMLQFYLRAEGLALSWVGTGRLIFSLAYDDAAFETVASRFVAAVENAVSADAFRPGDILRTRKGLTVEVNNTDAEGRLVLADALSFGAEAEPDLMISMATLTGAARVAVGADIAPYFTDDGVLSGALDAAAAEVADPVWRMPFHEPYEAMIEPGIADLDNAPSGGFAGAITAALFLRRFAGGTRYAHFDIYGWNQSAAPGRPKGGVGMGARALLQALPEVLAL